jgi:hypothetical protein
MIQLPLSVIGDVVLAHFLSTSPARWSLALVASAVLGFIVWWGLRSWSESWRARCSAFRSISRQHSGVPGRR